MLKIYQFFSYVIPFWKLGVWGLEKPIVGN